MKYENLLPDYPRTRHLSYKPNAQRLDLIATEEECKVIFENENTFIEEKVDGANSGICLFEGNPVIRNRNNFFHKGKTGHSRTPAKMQFASIYNWFYANQDKFEKLNELNGGPVSVYGEWMYALHGIKYDKLPSHFMPFDLYDWEKSKFIPTGTGRELLELSGFVAVPLLHKGKVPSWEFLEKLCEVNSPFSSTDLREGVYVKVSSKDDIIGRFKMVRSGFIQGHHWSDKQITKNGLAK